MSTHEKTALPEDEDQFDTPRNQTETEVAPENQPAAKGWRFWAIFPPLVIATLLMALESTVTATALPKIAEELNSGENYVWFLNGYLLTATIFLPLYGQLADVAGRRWPTIFAVATFVLGSGISGGATSTAMLIAGRLVQGLGGGGINSMSQIIISDLVPVRERPQYMALVFAFFGIGTAIGPPIGGVVAQYNWRWAFYLNLPLGGITLVLQLLFLKVNYVKQTSFLHRLKQIDWIGNAILSASVIAILVALSWADTKYPWSSWHIIVPLVIGFAGMGFFHVYEASPWVAELATITPRIWTNRTSVLNIVLVFIQSMLMYWATYFLPVYFQSVLLASTTRAGVLLLPYILFGIPSAIVAGAVMTKIGKYKPVHFFGFASSVLGFGLCINFSATSSLAKVVLYQMVTGFAGVLLVAMLPAIQAAHPQSDVSAVTSSWNFYRAFGGMWGIAIPSAIFNSQMASRASSIASPAVAAEVAGGDAYSHVSSIFISSLPEPVQSQVISAYSDSMRIVWAVGLALAAVAVLCVFFEAEIPMQTELEASEFGLKGVVKAEEPELASIKPSSGEETTRTTVSQGV